MGQPGNALPDTIPYTYPLFEGNDDYVDQWFFIEQPIAEDSILINVVIDCFCDPEDTPEIVTVPDMQGDYCEGDELILTASNLNTQNNIGLIDYELIGPNPHKSQLEFGSHYYQPSELRQYKPYDVLVTDKWDVFSLGVTLLKLIYDDLWRRNETLEDLRKKFNEGFIDLFMDQKSVQSNSVLNKYAKEEFFIELKDLIINMINDDVEERYNIDNVINHRWFQKVCADNSNQTGI